MEDRPPQDAPYETEEAKTGFDENHVVAKPARGYTVRILLIAVLVTGFSAYFLYDGYIGYPRQNAIYESYEQYLTEYKEEGPRKWREDIKDPTSDVYGMPSDQSGHPGYERTETDIFTQKLLGFGLAPIAALSIFYLIMFYNRSVRLEGDHIKAYGNVDFTFDDITRVDRTRWVRKGIAIVHYNKDGNVGKLTLDDWKFDRLPIKYIMAKIEENVDESKFIDPEDLGTSTQTSEEASDTETVDDASTEQTDASPEGDEDQSDDDDPQR